MFITYYSSIDFYDAILELTKRGLTFSATCGDNKYVIELTGGY